MAVRWPEGARSAGVACGIKAGDLDLGILVLDGPGAWAGTFTQNAAAAAPVRWCRSIRGNDVHALVVNSGNANACTGEAGELAVRETAAAAATLLGCEADQVLVASTGPIGVPLPLDKIVSSLPVVATEVTDDPAPFARSIMTTDSHPKIVSLDAGDARVVGVAKGAAMIAPNMATMLAFIVTDAKADAATLSEILTSSVQRSFNRISVDACESTNDSVLLLATGRTQTEPNALREAVQEVCSRLAEMIVRDAEGGTKLMRIRLQGARDEEHAAMLGRAVAASDLWRAAANGCDPNWGRILAAMGAADRTLSLEHAEISIGPEIVFSCGSPAGSLDVAAKVMAEDDYVITCVVGSGDGSAEVLAADLSTEYVRLNAEVTT